MGGILIFAGILIALWEKVNLELNKDRGNAPFKE